MIGSSKFSKVGIWWTLFWVRTMFYHICLVHLDNTLRPVLKKCSWNKWVYICHRFVLHVLVEVAFVLMFNTYLIIRKANADYKWSICLGVNISLWAEQLLSTKQIFGKITKSSGHTALLCDWSSKIGHFPYCHSLVCICCSSYFYGWYCLYSSPPPPLSMGDIFQDLRWMPETLGNTKPYIYTYVFSYTSILKV